MVLYSAHRLKHLQPAPGRVDSPTLAAHIAREYDFHISRLAVGPRWRDERAGRRLAPRFRVAQVLKLHAVEDSLARRQPAQVDLAREISGVDDRRAGDSLRIGESLARCPFDEHSGRPIAATP